MQGVSSMKWISIQQEVQKVVPIYVHSCTDQYLDTYGANAADWEPQPLALSSGPQPS